MYEPSSPPVSFFSGHRPAITLAGIFFAYLVLDVIGPLAAHDGSYFGLVVFGAVATQPIFVGAWAALAPGSWLLRMPVVLACSVLLLLAPTLNRWTIGFLRPVEYIALAVAALTIFIATMCLMLLVRKMFQFHIEPGQLNEPVSNQPTRFSINYLLGLTTLYAVVLGMAAPLQIRSERPVAYFQREMMAVIFMITIPFLLATLLPLVMVPLFILSRGLSDRAMKIAILAWLITTVAVVAIGAAIDSGPVSESVETVLLFQLGAFIAGFYTGVPLRLAGFRLVKNNTSRNLDREIKALAPVS